MTTSISYHSNAMLLEGDADYVVGITGKFPASTSNEDTDTTFDQFTSSWRAGATLGTQFVVRGKQQAPGQETLPAVLRITALPEFGWQDFIYYPQGGGAQSSTWHFSWDGALDVLYFDLQRVLGLQATYRVGIDWASSPLIGIISPSAPTLVGASKVVSDATVQPNMMGRLFLYKSISANFAIGPSVALSVTGPQGSAVAFNQAIAGRAEFWLYFLPPKVKPVNLRIGLSPYVSAYFRNSDSQGRTVIPGALFQVRYGGGDMPVYAY